MSDPRKMMYSYTSSLGATGLSVGRSSVPKERTERYGGFSRNYKTIYLILTFSQSHSGHLSINGVEDSLIANLRFGDQTDLGAKVGNTTTATRHLSPVKHSGQNEN